MATDDTNTPKEDSLENVIETDSLESSNDSGVRAAPEDRAATKKAPGENPLKRLFRKFNIYLLLFILILIISGAVVLITTLSQKKSNDATIANQAIPSDVLNQLSKADATIGDPKQVLSDQSNAVFAGKVLIRDNLDVAGQIHVNGSLSLPGISVSGDSTFDQVQINKTLSIGGDTSVLGQLNVKKNISVSGGGTFGGPITAPQITTNQLQMLGDLNLTNHIVAGGATPGRSGGAALGAGGTASLSGTDTGGSISIGTGSGPGAGCFVTVNFTSRYNNTPHVVVTPVGSGAAGIQYYITRSTSSFSVCSASTPPANSSFGFDYIVIG